MNFILYRMVGGFIGTGNTFLTRARFAIGVGLYMAFLAVVKQRSAVDAAAIFVLCALGAFLGRLIPHARFQNGASLANMAGMAAIGLARLTLIITPYALTIDFEDWYDLTPMLFTLDPWAMGAVLFGLLQGPSYYFGWPLDGVDSGIYYRNQPSQVKIRPGVVLPDENPAEFLDQAAVGGGEWGELFTGMFSYNLPYLFLLVIP